MADREDDLRKFVEWFAGNVYNEDMRRSDYVYARYYENVRGGWSEKNQMLRKNYLENKFVEKYNILELDSRRQISENEKIEAFAKHPNCERCGKRFTNYNEPEYHHDMRYADGGSTELENIRVLCRECHDIVHGKKIETIDSDDEDLDEDADLD